MHKKIGIALRKIRESRKLSLRQAEEIIGLDHSVIGRIENGEHEPQLSTLQKFADGYKTTVLAILKKAGVK